LADTGSTLPLGALGRASCYVRHRATTLFAALEIGAGQSPPFHMDQIHRRHPHEAGRQLVQRCRIVLGCAAGKSNKEAAAGEGVWSQTVGKWRGRFLDARLEGLADEPRPGAPPGH
jgi:hypothetical protein